MTLEDIPEKIRRFLKENVDSLGALELLLFLWKNAGREWDAVSASAFLRMNPSSTGRQLTLFSAKGILIARDSQPPAYSLNLQFNGIKEMMEKLSRLYEERLNSLIECIYSPPIDSIRSFANAFKIRKENDE